MKLYRDDTGAWHRTQADAKASGRPWNLVEVPTDHHGLHAFLNSLRSPEPEPEPAPEPVIEAPDHPYRNGDPAPAAYGTRDPASIAAHFLTTATPEWLARQGLTRTS